MKKSSISKTELGLINKLRQNDLLIFTLKDIELLLNLSKSKVYNLIKSMIKKKLIVKISSNKYILTIFSEEADILKISTKIIWPSYISFWTALSYYNLTEQIVRKIFLCTTGKKSKIKFNDTVIEFIKINRRRFFGYTSLDGIIIAEKEKAIIDSLLLSRYAGGIKEIFKCLRNAWDELDKDKLIKYAVIVNNKSVVKRLGYLIEMGKLKLEEEKKKKLLKKIGRGYSKLDPQLKGNYGYSKKWKLIFNVPNLLDMGDIL